MIHVKKIVSPILVLFFFLQASSQKNASLPANNIVAKFADDLQASTREKMFVQTDKWFYLAGETIWFKAYCLDAASHRLSSYSKTVMVDLVNDNDKVIRQILLNNQRLLTSGDILLPTSLPEGDYWLRAYTAHMLKQDSTDIFVKHIYIFNGGKQPISPELRDDSPRVVFFPEGGAVIEGTDQFVAMKVSDTAGNPIVASGYITDEEDSARAKFTTSLQGLGSFSYYVQPGEFTAHVKWRDGKYYSYPLPEARPGAARLSLLKSSDTAMEVMVALGDSLFRKDEETIVMAVQRGRVYYAAAGHGMYQLDIPRKVLPAGENLLVLIDKNEQVLSERPFYLDKKNILIDVKPDKDNYGDREKVKLDISVEDIKGSPQMSLLSVSVTDNKLVSLAPEKNEAASLPATDNGLTGSYSPGEKELALLAADSRLSHITNPGPAKKIPHNEEDTAAIGIRGSVLTETGAPKSKKVVTLLGEGNEPSGRAFFGIDTTNDHGRFGFKLANYTEGTPFFLDVKNLRGVEESSVIALDSFQFPRFSTPRKLKQKFYGTAASLPYFTTYVPDTGSFGKGRQWLEAVTVNGRKKDIVPEDSRRLSRFSTIIYGDEFAAGAHSVSNAIIMAHGVHYFNKSVVIGGISGFSGASEPLLVVDGIPVPPDNMTSGTDSGLAGSPLLTYIDGLFPSKDMIDFIEVLSGPEASIYGFRGGNGVISITTKKGLSRENERPGASLKKMYAVGYHHSNPFTGPDYSKEEEIKKNPGGDQRPTLYWNGDILTDENGKATVSFYTSDQASTYTVTLEGITLQGDIIYKRILIQRK